MSIIGSNILAGASGQGGASYTIENSLRFRSTASAYLSRTFGSGGNLKTYTISFWIKRGKLGAQQFAFTGFNGSINGSIQFTSSDTFEFNVDGGVNYRLTTTQVFRDPSAWYHVVCVADTTQATSSNRLKIYVNGVQVTSFGTATYPTLNYDTKFFGAYSHWIGASQIPSLYTDGYLAEFNAIDGQALTPSDFGEYNADTGVWQPIAYAGTYGTNGFYLPFSDATNTTTLVADSSGNGNDWTPNNISLTAGVTYDSMTDTPTIYADGGNYAVLNPLDRSGNAFAPTTSNANLSAAPSGNPTHIWSTITLPVGSTEGWYWEGVCTSMDTARTYVGIIDPTTTSGAPGASYAFVDKAILSRTGGYFNTGSGTGGTPSATFTAYAVNDVVMIAYKNGKIWFGKNGTWMNSGDPAADTNAVDSAVSTARAWRPYFGYNSSWTANFGQRPFAYTPPTGFLPLHTGNLPDSTIVSGDDYFKTYLYTGNGGGLQVGEIQKPFTTYEVSNSLRLRKSASAYLNRTFSTGNRKTFTFSAWVKKAIVGSSTGAVLFGSTDNVTSTSWLYFNTAALGSTDALTFQDQLSSTVLVTTQLFRDPSAWYHIILAVDTTQATPSNRAKLFVNGTQIISFSTATYPTQNVDTNFNRPSSFSHTIGTQVAGSRYFDGYLAEVNFIDGQALTPSDLGDYDGNNYWVPKAYTGTYGTNGFYLDFSDTTSTATLVADQSGAGNDWTPNNISLTAGTTYDSMIDVPTLYADGGNGRGNYWTFDPLVPVAGATYSSGNLQYTSNTANKSGFAQPLPATGKWYWEGVWLTNGGGSNPIIGIAQAGFENTQGATGELGIRTDGNSFDENASAAAYGASWTIGDVIGVSVDMDVGTIAFSKNGVSQGTAFTTVLTALTQPVKPMFRVNAANDAFAINFGQRPFAYTPPTDFKALNSFNIAEVTDDLETPDLVWIKSRSAAQSHTLFDSVRGVHNYLESDDTAIEATDVNSLLQFNKNGFLLGASAAVNTSGRTYVGWGWKAGAAFSNDAGTNGATIASVGSVNQDAGFSIVTYTGNGTSGATVSHGLSVAPSLILPKVTSRSGDNWHCYHSALGGTKGIILNVPNKETTDAGFWNNTNPSSSVFTLGTYNVFSEQDYVAYCFAEVPGYSSFGSYTGNGSTDGVFVHLGFRPAFVMTKRTDSAGGWIILDSERSPNNVAQNILSAQAPDQDTGSTYNVVDFLSNGFKLRITGDPNTSGAPNIYMAFAENPFKNSLAR